MAILVKKKQNIAKHYTEYAMEIQVSNSNNVILIYIFCFHSTISYKVLILKQVSKSILRKAETKAIVKRFLN